MLYLSNVIIHRQGNCEAWAKKTYNETFFFFLALQSSQVEI